MRGRESFPDNVIACNVDDHAKNFSFLMDRKGQWSLAPAYDLTFSVDLEALPFENYHTFSVKDARKAIDEVRDAVRQFPEIARRNEVPEELINQIADYLGKV